MIETISMLFNRIKMCLENFIHFIFGVIYRRNLLKTENWMIMRGGMKCFLLLTKLLDQGRLVEELLVIEEEAIAAGHTCSLSRHSLLVLCGPFSWLVVVSNCGQNWTAGSLFISMFSESDAGCCCCCISLCK